MCPVENKFFEFFGKVLSGTEEQRDDWRRATNLVDGTVGEVVGKVYVKNHFPPEAKERMLELVGNLVKAWGADVDVTLNCAAEKVDWSGSGVTVETVKGTIRARTALVTVSKPSMTTPSWNASLKNASPWSSVLGATF